MGTNTRLPKYISDYCPMGCAPDLLAVRDTCRNVRKKTLVVRNYIGYAETETASACPNTSEIKEVGVTPPPPLATAIEAAF